MDCLRFNGHGIDTGVPTRQQALPAARARLGGGEATAGPVYGRRTL
jgi:hypothetical protein